MIVKTSFRFYCCRKLRLGAFLMQLINLRLEQMCTAAACLNLLSKSKSKAKHCRHGETKRTARVLLPARSVPPGCLAIRTIFYEALFQGHAVLMLNFSEELQKHGGGGDAVTAMDHGRAGGKY